MVNTKVKGCKNFLDKDNKLEVIFTELRDEVRFLKKDENIRKHDLCKGKFIISLVLNNYFINDE